MLNRDYVTGSGKSSERTGTGMGEDMILVDVTVPSVEKTYDFNLDENAQIALVIEEISVMISQKEHCAITGNKDELLLCKYDGQVVLDRNSTLRESGLVNGGRLLLV